MLANKQEHFSLLNVLACLLLITFTMTLSVTVKAENMKKLGALDVHYIAINATFLTPEIATAYGITRSKINALVNISVLDNTLAGKPAKSANIFGTATNLLGQSTTLEFIEVKEGDAIYYLAELNFTNEEIFRFDIKILSGDNNETLKFQHKFYVD